MSDTRILRERLTRIENHLWGFDFESDHDRESRHEIPLEGLHCTSCGTSAPGAGIRVRDLTYRSGSRHVKSLCATCFENERTTGAVYAFKTYPHN